MTTGALFAAPIPETYEAVGLELQKSVEQAVRESEENGVSRRGKEATPWLLKRVGELTQGRSLGSSKS
jgi:pseudouridine-5'-phosphate glycosidase/pseudouridine kinase